jgi:hypothetical protein
VQLWNAELKLQFGNAYLDFFSELHENGTLRKEFVLDGIHMSPAYIPLLVKALAACGRVS